MSAASVSSSITEIMRYTFSHYEQYLPVLVPLSFIGFFLPYPILITLDYCAFVNAIDRVDIISDLFAVRKFGVLPLSFVGPVSRRHFSLGNVVSVTSLK